MKQKYSDEEFDYMYRNADLSITCNMDIFLKYRNILKNRIEYVDYISYKYNQVHFMNKPIYHDDPLFLNQEEQQLLHNILKKIRDI